MPPSATLISAEEYLRTTYKPACDYADGVLRPKSMPTRKHGLLAGWLTELVRRYNPDFEAAAEVTLRIRQDKYLVPDVAVQDRKSIQDPYPEKPIHLCIEILSPGDRMSQTLAKCEEYHAWGVEYTWILDPVACRAWQYDRGHQLTEATDAITAGAISLRCSEVFSILT